MDIIGGEDTIRIFALQVESPIEDSHQGVQHFRNEIGILIIGQFIVSI